jgi:Protein of unknown function (DUF1116)
MEPNTEALERFGRGDAVLERIAPAREVLPALATGRVLTHAGPPIAYAAMCPPMQGALTGAVVFEGWAEDLSGAAELLSNGDIALLPNHHAGSVAPMAGVISPSMQTYVIRNPAHGNTAVTNFNEGNVPDSLRCGANGPAVINRLRWLNNVVAPAIGVSLPPAFSIRDIISTSVLMGDEQHQRNVAGSLLFQQALLPRLLTQGSAAAVTDYLGRSPQAFLNLAMAASKALLDPLSGIAGCSIVTAMSRNGVEFGIRVSSTGDRWFTAPSPQPDGVYWGTYTVADANPDIGDSAIVETAGLGGFALAGAPSLFPLVGIARRIEAEQLQDEMRRITCSENQFFLTSPAEHQGTPFAIDVLRVVREGVAPVITTGIAHRKAGVGQVGVGITRAPRECFVHASEALTLEGVRA